MAEPDGENGKWCPLPKVYVETGLPKKREGVVVRETNYMWPVEVRRATPGQKLITKAEIEYRMVEGSVHTPLFVWYNENNSAFGIEYVDREEYKPLNKVRVSEEGRTVLPMLAELTIAERRSLISQIIDHFRSTHAYGYLLDLNVVSERGVKEEDLERFWAGRDGSGDIWMYDLGEEEGVSAIPFGFQEKDKEEEEKLATYIEYQLARLVMGGQFETQIKGLVDSVKKGNNYQIAGVGFQERLVKILNERKVNGLPQIVEVLRRCGYDQIAETVALAIEEPTEQGVVNLFRNVNNPGLERELERLGREKSRLQISGLTPREVDSRYPRAETEWQTAHRETLEEEFMNELDQLAAIVAIIAGGGYDPAVIVPLVKKLDVKGEYKRAVGETEAQMTTRWQAVGKVYLYIEEFGETQLEREQRK